MLILVPISFLGGPKTETAQRDEGRRSDIPLKSNGFRGPLYVSAFLTALEDIVPCLSVTRESREPYLVSEPNVQSLF